MERLYSQRPAYRSYNMLRKWGSLMLLFLFTTSLFANGPGTKKGLDLTFTSATEDSAFEPATDFVYTITVSGGSGSATFSLGHDNDESYFDLDGDQLTFSTSLDYGSPYDDGSDNTYIAEIIVTDGDEEINQLVTISILDVIEVYFNNRPDTYVSDGRPYFSALEPVDEDSREPLIVTSATLPDWLSLTQSPFANTAFDRHLISDDFSFGFFNRGQSSVFDSDGNIYWTVARMHAVFKATPEGVVTILAGDKDASGTDEGTGTDARFNNPVGIDIDAFGNLYVADEDGERIRKITSEGIVTTLAGRAGDDGSTDGTGTDARFYEPEDVLVGTDGNIYVNDAGNRLIRKITPEGVVSTFAGVGGYLDSEDVVVREGAALNVTFSDISDIAMNSLGELFVADRRLASLLKIDTEGMVTLVTGPEDSLLPDLINGDISSYDLDLELPISGDVSMAFGPGDILLTKINSDDLYSVDSEFNVTRVGVESSALVDTNSDVVFDTEGNLYTILKNNRNSMRLIRIDFAIKQTLTGTPNGDIGENEVTLFVANAGGQTAEYTFTINVSDETSPEASFANAVDFQENGTGVVQALTATDNNPNAELTFQFLTEAAAECEEESGDCYNYPGGDGGEDSPEFYDDSRFFEIRDNQLFFLEAPDAENPLDNNGNNVYVLAFELSDGSNRARVFLQVTVTDEDDHEAFFVSEPITTVERDDFYQYNVKVGDADASAANNEIGGVVLPEWLTLENSLGGIVDPIAGSGEHGSSDGTGTSAQFNGPTSAVSDGEGNLYITDAFAGTIRKVSAEGVVTTLAGSGSSGSDDGTGTSAEFYLPLDLVIGIDGNIYVADSDNGLIRRVTTDGSVTTFAGGGGDDEGTGTSAYIDSPNAITVDAEGNLYVIVDNRRIKKISPEGVVSILAGSDRTGYYDGTGTDAAFRHLDDISIDSEGNLYVTDLENVNIRKVTPEGVVSTFWNGLDSNDLANLEQYVQNGYEEEFRGNSSFYDGYEYGYPQEENSYYASMPFFRPRGIVIGSDDKIYVSGLYKSSIMVFNSQGMIVETLEVDLPDPVEEEPGEGDGPEGGDKPGPEGPAESENTPFRPRGLAVDEVNNLLYVTDMGGATVQSISLGGAVLVGDPSETPGSESAVTLALGNGVQQDFTITIEGEPIVQGPELIESFPADDSNNFNSNTLTFTFDSNVQKGSGIIEVVDDVERGKVLFQIGVRHPNVTIVDNVVSVKMTRALPNGFNLFTRISAGAFINEAGGSFDGIDNKSDLNFATASAPVIVSSTPESEGEDFAGTALTFTFDTNVTKGSGAIQVFRNLDDGSDGVESAFRIGVRHPSVTIDENVVTVQMDEELPIESSFYISIPEGGFISDAGINFAGIRKGEEISFRTAEAPYIEYSDPRSGSEGFTGKQLRFYFNTDIRKGAGSIEVIPTEGDADAVFSIGVRHPNVSVNGSQVEVTMPNDLPLGTSFYIMISPGAFTSTAGIDFEGVTDERDLSFLTASAPAIIASYPEDGSEGFLENYFRFSFDSEISKGSGTISLIGDGVDPFIIGVNHPNVFIKGNTVTVEMGRRLPFNTSYSLVLPEGAFIGSGDEPKRDEPKGKEPKSPEPKSPEPKSIGLKSSAVVAGQITFETGGPAQLVSSNPENGGTLSGKLITLNFDRDIAKGTGSISIKDVNDNSTLFTTGINHLRVRVNGTTVEITLPNELPKDKSLSLNMSATALKGIESDLFFEPSLGEDGVALFFDTGSALKVVSLTPEDGDNSAADGNQVGSLTMVFNKAIKKGSGAITVFNASDDSEVFKMGVNHPKVTVSEDRMTVNLRGRELPADGSYYVQVSLGVVVAGSERFTGIADKTTWNFSNGTPIPSVPAQNNLGGELLNAKTEVSINIFPNPASTEVSIDLTSLGEQPALRFTTADGTVVFSKENISTSVIRVDVSSYKAGVYLVIAQSQDGRFVRKKFIISK